MHLKGCFFVLCMTKRYDIYKDYRQHYKVMLKFCIKVLHYLQKQANLKLKWKKSIKICNKAVEASGNPVASNTTEKLF